MGIERTCGGDYGEHWWRHARRGTMCAAALFSLILAAESASASSAMIATSGQTSDRFVLAPDRPATMPATPMRRRPPLAGVTVEQVPLVGLIELGRARLNRLFAIRRDLRFIVNGSIEEARKERIALGLHFERTF